MHLASQSLGALTGGDAHGASRVQIDERGGDFAPIAELEGTLSQTASGYDSDGVGHASIDLDVCDEALAVFPVWIVESEQLESEHGHAHAEYLPGAKVSVGYFSVAKKLVE
jgi:hypothetical protein